VLNAGQMQVKGDADGNAKTELTLTWTEAVLRNSNSILITRACIREEETKEEVLC